MEEKRSSLAGTCSFANVRPIMMDLPYPPIQVKERNLAYANLLSIDYCGSVSEMTAIVQYVNNENRIFTESCSAAKTLLGIAMAEMMHLQKLGELIHLLGGNVDFWAKPGNGRPRMWTPEYLTLPENIKNMILTDIESEKAAINQYRMHMKMINDTYINAILARIINDEEYHVMILQVLMKEMGSMS